MKRKIFKKIELIFSYISVILIVLGIALMVALLIFGPVLQTQIYYLLLTCGLGGVTGGLLIYLFIFGELKN